MTVGEKMRAYRKQHGYSLRDMSQKSGASETLLKMVEGGMVTHPVIAANIASAYDLSKTDEYALTPENYRPNSDKYDPDKYREPEFGPRDWHLKPKDVKEERGQ